MAKSTTRTWTSTASNLAMTWATNWCRHSWQSCGWWGIFDQVGHNLHLPRWLQRPLCDRYEIAAGIPREDLIEMDYTRNGKRTPWWLRR